MSSTQVTGKNVEAGDAFAGYVSDKIKGVVEKYLKRPADSHVRLEKERGLFKTSCSVRLASGLVIEANGEGGDAYASADDAVHRLETRVRRYKERLKSHAAASSRRQADWSAPDYVVSVEDEQSTHDENNPLIIAEHARNISEMTVGDAVMQLDVSDAPFLIFRNAGHGEVNIVYKRADGHVGWVDATRDRNAQPNGSGRAPGGH